jgi:hypothetical protein
MWMRRRGKLKNPETNLMIRAWSRLPNLRKSQSLVLNVPILFLFVKGDYIPCKLMRWSEQQLVGERAREQHQRDDRS